MVMIAPRAPRPAIRLSSAAESRLGVAGDDPDQAFAFHRLGNVLLEPGDGHHRLWLSSHGHRREVGAFLAEQERIIGVGYADMLASMRERASSQRASAAGVDEAVLSGAGP